VSCRGRSKDGTYRNNQGAGPWAQLLVLIQVPVGFDALKFTSEPKGTASSATALQMKRPSVGLPFEFTRLTRCTFHVLQLEHSLEDLGDNLGDQLRAKGPSQNIAADVIFLGPRVNDLRGLHKRAFLNGNETSSVDCEATELTFWLALDTSR